MKECKTLRTAWTILRTIMLMLALAGCATPVTPLSLLGVLAVGQSDGSLIDSDDAAFSSPIVTEREGNPLLLYRFDAPIRSRSQRFITQI